MPLLAVRDLSASFGSRPAVAGVSMTIHPGQTLAVVGESGCGKSVTALSLLGLLPPGAARVEGGAAMFQGRDLLRMSERELRAVRGRRIAMIFQEPMTSLNPVFTIGEQIVEAIRLHQRVGRAEARRVAADALARVGIADPRRRLGAYPHEFSGGMRQRVMIAMALACRPSLLLADEPTTALDVTMQRQILDLLRSIQRDTGMAIMLITHDLGVVSENADVVCVMYGGRVVEYAATAELFGSPLHPYTRALLACVPSLAHRRERLTTVAETLADPSSMVVPGDPDMRPWWPSHPAPPDAGPPAGAVLAQVRPGRWVGLWNTPAALNRSAEPPDVVPATTLNFAEAASCTP